MEETRSDKAIMMLPDIKHKQLQANDNRFKSRHFGPQSAQKWIYGGVYHTVSMNNTNYNSPS